VRLDGDRHPSSTVSVENGERSGKERKNEETFRTRSIRHEGTSEDKRPIVDPRRIERPDYQTQKFLTPDVVCVIRGGGLDDVNGLVLGVNLGRRFWRFPGGLFLILRVFFPRPLVTRHRVVTRGHG